MEVKTTDGMSAEHYRTISRPEPYVCELEASQVPSCPSGIARIPVQPRKALERKKQGQTISNIMYATHAAYVWWRKRIRFKLTPVLDAGAALFVSTAWCRILHPSPPRRRGALQPRCSSHPESELHALPWWSTSEKWRLIHVSRGGPWQGEIR